MQFVDQVKYQELLEKATVGAYKPPPSYFGSLKPYIAKIHSAMARFADQLPFRLAHKIAEVRFGPEGAADPHFEVVFMGGKVIEFHDIDAFPSDVDIARVCVECP